MPNVDYDDVARVARETVPGETVEARIVDGEGVVVSVEPGRGEGGEDLCHVSYVAFVADEPREESPEDRANGPGLDVRVDRIPAPPEALELAGRGTSETHAA